MIENTPGSPESQKEAEIAAKMAEIEALYNRIVSDQDRSLENIGQMIDYSREAERIEDGQPATGRNFEIATREDTLCLQKTGQPEIDLKTILPKKIKFVAGEEFSYSKNKGQNIVTYKPETLGARGFMLSIFHEIGHAALEMTPRYQTRMPFKKYLRVLKETFFDYLKDSFRKDKTKTRPAPADSTVDINEDDLDDAFPKWFLQEEAQLVEKNERDAWAISLRQLRQLDRRGYNVFAGFEDKKQIQDFIANQFVTYEMKHALEAARIELRPDKEYLSLNR